MSPWPAPETSEPLEGDAPREHYQLVLRKIWKWFIVSDFDQPQSHDFWRELRDAERPLYRQGAVVDVASIEAVIEAATQLGYPGEH